MTISAVASLITAQSKTAPGSPFDENYTVTTAASVGDICILCIAKDNTAAADANTSEVTNVTDSGGNNWVKIREFCNAQTGAGLGATVAVWKSVLRTALTTSSTITVRYSAGITAKAVTGFRFTGTLTRANLSFRQAGTDLANDAADAGSQTTTPPSNKEWLFIRAGACETNVNTHTAAASFTKFTETSSNTTGAGAGTNMQAYAEYRILTTNAATANDPTTTAVDQASVYLLFEEVSGQNTHSIDALLKATLTKTHSVDADLLKTIRITHSEDAFVVRRFTKTHSVDSDLKATLTKTHSVDMLLKKTVTFSSTFSLENWTQSVVNRTVYGYGTFANPVYGGTAGSGQDFQALSQSFTIRRNYPISYISLEFEKFGSPIDNFYIKVTSSLGGAAIATSNNVSGSSIVTATFIPFIFATPFSLTPGTKYYIELYRDGARDQTNYIQWRSTYYNFFIDYPTFDLGVRVDNAWVDAWGGPSNIDAIFEIFSNNASLVDSLLKKTQSKTHSADALLKQTNGNISIESDFSATRDSFITLYGGSGGFFESVAQSFQLSRSSYVSEIDLFLAKTLSPTDNLYIVVTSTNGGSAIATSNLVASSSLSAAVFERIGFTFSSSFLLSASTTYYIELYRDGARDTSNYVTWGENNSGNPYANGQEYRKTSGSWSGAGLENNDLIFDVIGHSLFNKIDASLSAATTLTITHLIDSLILQTRSKTHSVDSLLSKTRTKTHLVDTYIVDKHFAIYTFEGGTNGAVITTSDTGSGTHFNHVQGGPTYSTTTPINGTTYGTSTAGNKYVYWDGFKNWDDWYFSFYMRKEVAGAGNFANLTFGDNATSIDFGWNSSNKMRIFDNTHQTTATFSLNTIYRIEIETEKVADTVTMNIYAGHSTTLIDSVTVSPAGMNGKDLYWAICFMSDSGFVMSFDDINVNPFDFPSTQKTHSIDALIQKTQASTHSVDVLLKKTQTKTHLIDADLKKTLTKTHSINIGLSKNLIYNSFEGGTNTTVITVANSGAASGNAFDDVAGSPTFTSTSPAHGSLSATDNNPVYQWDTSFGGDSGRSEFWGRFYFKTSGYPGSTEQLVEFSTQAHAEILLTSSGFIEIRDNNSGSPLVTGTVPIGLNIWVRIEFHMKAATGAENDGTIETKLFSPLDSTTPVDTVTSITADTGSGVRKFGRYLFTFTGSGLSWHDDFQLNTTGYPGPGAGASSLRVHSIDSYLVNRLTKTHSVNALLQKTRIRNKTIYPLFSGGIGSASTFSTPSFTLPAGYSVVGFIANHNGTSGNHPNVKFNSINLSQIDGWVGIPSGGGRLVSSFYNQLPVSVDTTSTIDITVTTGTNTWLQYCFYAVPGITSTTIDFFNNDFSNSITGFSGVSTGGGPVKNPIFIAVLHEVAETANMTNFANIFDVEADGGSLVSSWASGLVTTTDISWATSSSGGYLIDALSTDLFLMGVGIDSLVKKTQTKTHSIDAYLFTSGTAITHSIDALIKKTFSKTHLIDSLLNKTLAQTHLVDALLKKTLTKTHQVDALLNKTETSTHLIDGLLKKTQTKTHEIDSLLKKTQIQTHLVDALLNKTLTKTHLVDALLNKTLIKTHSVDSLLNKTETSTHLIDSLLKKTLTKTHEVTALLTAGTVKFHAADALLRKTEASTHSLDALIQKTYFISHSADALLRKTKAFDQACDALLKKTQTQTCQIDSLIKKTFNATHQVDALLSKTEQNSHTIDSLLRKTETSTHSVDADLRKTETSTHQLDADLKKTETSTHLVDALILQTFTKTHSVDSLLRKTQTKTHDIDSLLRRQQYVTHSVDAITTTGQAVFHALDSLLRKTQTKTHLVDALIQQTFTKTHSLDSLLKKTETSTHTIDADLRKTETSTHSEDALILKTQTQTHSIDSLLKKTQTKTHLIDALLSTGTSKLCSIEALLKKTLSNTHSYDALIQKTTSSLHFVAALLQKTQTQTCSTDALLKKTQTLTCSADAFLKKTQTLTCAEDALLVNRRTKAYSIDASLRQTFTKTYSADCLILKTQSVQSSADADIKKTLSKTHSVDANLLQRFTKTYSLDSDILKTLTASTSIESLILKTQQNSHSVDAIHFVRSTVSHSMDVFLRKGSDVSNLVDALLRKTQTRTQGIDFFVGEIPEIHGEPGFGHGMDIDPQPGHGRDHMRADGAGTAGIDIGF